MGWLAGVVGAVIWAVSLAIYQPFMEPRGVWISPDTGEVFPPVAGNNTYWPRDVRQLAILLACAGIIVICRARVWATFIGVVTAVIWGGVDLWLDRIDVGGQAMAAWLAVAGVIGFSLTVAVAARVSAGHARRELTQHLAAGTAVQLAVVALLVTTPWSEPLTDRDVVGVERALSLFKVSLVVMFIVIAVGLIADQFDAAATALVAFFVGLAALAAWLATTSYGLVGLVGLFGVPVAASLVVAATRPVPRFRLVGVALASAALLLPAAGLLYFVGSAVGATMTALASNPPVNAADIDLSYTFVGLVIGLLLASTSYLVTHPAKQLATHTAAAPS